MLRPNRPEGPRLHAGTAEDAAPKGGTAGPSPSEVESLWPSLALALESESDMVCDTHLAHGAAQSFATSSHMQRPSTAPVE